MEAASFTIPMLPNLMRQIAWHGAAWQSYINAADAIGFETTRHAALQFAIHATMLHGLVPTQIADHAAVTLLPAAWSISLEWQFYLLAPLVLLLARSASGTILLCVASFVAYLAYRAGYWGDFDAHSFVYVPAHITASSGFFAIGIAGRLLFGRLRQVAFEPAAAASIGALAILCFAKDALGLLIWWVFFSYLVWGRGTSTTYRIFRRVTASRIPLFMGLLSYCIYILHRPIQVLMLAGAVHFGLHQRIEILTAQLLAIAVTIPAAFLVHKLIEAPGQTLGKRLATARGRVEAAA